MDTGKAPAKDTWKLGDLEFTSRLMLGTGKYATFSLMQEAHAIAGIEMVTIAVRRVNLSDRSTESLLDFIDRKKITVLPNTAGCYNA